MWVSGITLKSSGLVAGAFTFNPLNSLIAFLLLNLNKLFEKLFFYLMCMMVFLSVCLYLSVCLVPAKSKEVIRPPGTGTTHACELPNGRSSGRATNEVNHGVISLATHPLNCYVFELLSLFFLHG